MFADRLYRSKILSVIFYSGYYCPGGQNTDQPTAYQCSVGHYCPAGSLEEVRCESGTYQDETTKGSCKVSRKNLLHMHRTLESLVELGCLLLSEGERVSEVTSTYLFKKINLLFVLSSRSKKLLTFTLGITPCKGSLNAYILSQMCPKGYYCNNFLDPVVLYNNTLCPEGYYCPIGTRYATEYRCPRGTFANYMGLQNVTDCQPCPAGFYCDEEAQTNYTKPCTAGWVHSSALF